MKYMTKDREHLQTYADKLTSVASAYASQQRTKLVSKLYSMGDKFKQRTKTVQIGVDLMDRFFLDKRTSSSPQTPTHFWQVVMTTCFLIASKYDEIDDQLVFINDV